MKKARLVDQHGTLGINIFVSGWGTSKNPVVAGILQVGGATKLVTGHQIVGTNDFECEIRDLPGIRSCEEELDEFIHNVVVKNGLVIIDNQAHLSLNSPPEKTSDPLTKTAIVTMKNPELINTTKNPERATEWNQKSSEPRTMGMAR